MMKRFMLFYMGPSVARPTHEGWPEWFSKIGDALVDRGSPLKNGVVLHSDGSTNNDAMSLNGYCVIQADDRDQALDLVRDHPLLALGSDYTIELFEFPQK
jgi:hypothetical protein